MGVVAQQSPDDVNIHFVTVPADCMIAVDVPVTVYEVIHVAVMPLAVHYDILKIKLSRFREQREKFFRYILFRSEMMQMPSLFKKREYFLSCSFILNYLFMGYILIIKTVLKLFISRSKAWLLFVTFIKVHCFSNFSTLLTIRILTSYNIHISKTTSESVKISEVGVIIAATTRIMTMECFR